MKIVIKFMSGYFICIYIHVLLMCLVLTETKKEHRIPLEMELQTAVR